MLPTQNDTEEDAEDEQREPTFGDDAHTDWLRPGVNGPEDGDEDEEADGEED